ncbi:MAG: 4a-hydroxytetrahydrobiopterin dehydratase [Chitinophagaceae bacterium]
MLALLSEDQIQTKLSELPLWQYRDEHLYREFIFNDFKQALGFMVQVGLCAEILNHHPDMRNVYHTVQLKLRTHQPNGITELDFALAKAIDALG